MKILILNWRSIKDPWAGGAEVVTFEHAKRWIKNHNAEVFWISPKYDFNCKTETIEGVNFVYLGFPLGRNIFKLLISFPFFYLSVIYNCITQYNKSMDVVIDQVHGIPFLTPLYIKKKIIIYIHEIGGNIWRKMYPFPISYVGMYLERFLIKIPYQDVPFVTVSESTKSDLMALGIQEKNIHVIFNGVSVPISDEVPVKNTNLSIVFLNRVVKMKGIERALQVFRKVKSRSPEASLSVIGRVEKGYLAYLTSFCEELGLKDCVDFLGYTTEERKIDILSKSHVLINTSYKEGWGLVNLEANARGTPVVAFNVSGNKESIVNGVNGFLFSEDAQDLMADKIIELYTNQDIRIKALAYSKRFHWDTVSHNFYQILEKEYVCVKSQ